MKKYRGKLIYLPSDKAYWIINPINPTNFLTQAYGPRNLMEKLINIRLVEVVIGEESYSIKAV
ncbi:MAG TPA: hypothetical protein ENH12_04410 [Proteobacteria bacterium]|nr:hypothetical protein [Pseudomonadota bacterium]